jgi:hypothetical protein
MLLLQYQPVKTDAAHNERLRGNSRRSVSKLVSGYICTVMMALEVGRIALLRCVALICIECSVLSHDNGSEDSKGRCI